MALKKDIDSLLLMLLSRFFPVLRGLINESLFAPVGAYARKVKIIASASLIRIKTTIASDVKIKCVVIFVTPHCVSIVKQWDD